jgi:DNA-binding MarR family transcriptional regulator
MSEESKLEKAARKAESRYELVIVKDDAGFEHLTIERIGAGEAAKTQAELDEDEYPRHLLVDLACRIYDTRRERSRFFTSSVLGEPVWDMLLALYCLPARQQRLTMTGLATAAGVPPTTALRWTRLMEQKGMIVRNADPQDGRRVHIEMTQAGERLMNAYLASIYRRLAPSAP